ncbi:hypothetical protein RRG08_038570 [Elysia crispata]|uniref:Transmembrane protein n=1 Tax=Elysia crispata TaxID=231223 RepID=A0AAE0YGR8_9GAST|nr:hypothetical protein RRG08_038570 [Elysia crispata]
MYDCACKNPGLGVDNRPEIAKTRNVCLPVSVSIASATVYSSSHRFFPILSLCGIFSPILFCIVWCPIVLWWFRAVQYLWYDVVSCWFSRLVVEITRDGDTSLWRQDTDGEIRL